MAEPEPRDTTLLKVRLRLLGHQPVDNSIPLARSLGLVMCHRCVGSWVDPRDDLGPPCAEMPP